MALVVLLRGVNVGGYRTFRPSALARELKDLDVVNVGAAGTFVVRRRVTHARLRAELARRLQFSPHVTICEGRDLLTLTARDFFSSRPARPDTVRFVSVLPRAPRARPAVPFSIPANGEWLVQVLAAEGRFIVGVYRRHMRTIGCLGALDRMFGAPAVTRNWSTMNAVAELLRTRGRRPNGRAGTHAGTRGRTAARSSRRRL